MDIEFMTNPDAPPPPPTAAYSHAVRAGDLLFVTGQLGVDPKTGALVPGGVAEQTHQIMRTFRPSSAARGRASNAWQWSESTS